MSGIASQTYQYVQAVHGLPVKILDTRKTLPGWRHLEKYAVRAGGGQNHRLGLHDMVLIKDNHLAGWSAGGATHTIPAAIQTAQQSLPPGMLVEVEVDTLDQLRLALTAQPDMVLLDNMTCDELRAAVALRDTAAPQILLEASGGVNLDTVAAMARTGVDRISVGALTHSAPALDLALDWHRGS